MPIICTSIRHAVGILVTPYARQNFYIFSQAFHPNRISIHRMVCIICRILRIKPWGFFSQMALNILHIPVNFGCEIGHLWYIYMLIGLYLVTPIISPWLQQASKRELEGYLGLWIITTFLPYIHLVYPEVLGEAFWNDTPLLYYFTGFIGYFI